MIDSRNKLKEILSYEKKLYWTTGREGKYQYLLAMIKSHPNYHVWRYVKLLRKTGYFYFVRRKNLVYGCLYLWYCRRKNKLGRKLGIELNERSFEKGIVIYHTQGIVVNGLSVIGENCHLHGNNCIGTNGKTKACPKIGNNVTLGVGAKIIGDVEIADNIIIGAGAVVRESFLEPGITIGGIPARKLK